MAVQKKHKNGTKKIQPDAAEQNISGANVVTPIKPKKTPVALRFDPDLLASIDAMAGRRGMSRNAIISYWCSRAVESE